MEVNNSKIDFNMINTQSIINRINKVKIDNLLHPYSYKYNNNCGDKLKKIIDDIVKIRSKGLPVILFMGAHVIKSGLSLFIIEMARKGLITHIAGNGATSIHDFEIALIGGTSEDVAKSIEDGSFGMWEETGLLMNQAIQKGAIKGFGYGESLFYFLKENINKFTYNKYCVFFQCQLLGIPYTSHISLGTDIIHQHPTVDFGALAKTSGTDFESICKSVSKLNDGGAFLNFGSAELGPNIFLKAIIATLNLGISLNNIFIADFDISPYEHRQQVQRFNNITKLIEGSSFYTYQGFHSEVIPKLFYNFHFNDKLTHRKLQKDIEEMSKEANISNDSQISPSPKNYSECTEFLEFKMKFTNIYKNNNKIILFLGDELITDGGLPLLVKLLKKNVISHVAVTEEIFIQDIFSAILGPMDNKAILNRPEKTVNSIIYDILSFIENNQLGLGEGVINYSKNNPKYFPYLHNSIFNCCKNMNILYTCHPNIGSIILSSKENHYRILGKAGEADFKLYCDSVSYLEEGMLINIGSRVIGPEVFLKALSIVRNIGFHVKQIVTCNFDLTKIHQVKHEVNDKDWEYYYRPSKNIVNRPTSLGGIGYHFELSPKNAIANLLEFTSVE